MYVCVYVCVCVRAADEGDKEIGVQGNGHRSKVLRKRSP